MKTFELLSTQKVLWNCVVTRKSS